MQARGLTGIHGTQPLVIKWTLTLFIPRPQPHWFHLQEPRKLIWFFPRKFFALLNNGEILPSSVWIDLGCDAARLSLLTCSPGVRSLPAPRCPTARLSLEVATHSRPNLPSGKRAQGSSGSPRRPGEGKKPSFWRIYANERGGLLTRQGCHCAELLTPEEGDGASQVHNRDLDCAGPWALYKLN